MQRLKDSQACGILEVLGGIPPSSQGFFKKIIKNILYIKTTKNNKKINFNNYLLPNLMYIYFLSLI